MQLAAITTPAASAGATPTAAGAPRGPRFSGGIDFTGSGRFTAFSAKSTGGAYGEAAGYESLTQAIDALTMLTVGAHLPAAGIFERDGRFYGRAMHTALTFANGNEWEGPWRLEQHPADRELLDGTASGTTTRADALRAIVDGAHRIDVTHLPVGARKPRA